MVIQVRIRGGALAADRKLRRDCDRELEVDAEVSSAVAIRGDGPCWPRGDFARRVDAVFSSGSAQTRPAAEMRRKPTQLYDKHAPVDPIAANGEIFVDWPKPDVLLVFTGEQDGYLEPCGCAGLNNQKGGMKRRHTLLKQLAAKGWNVAAARSGRAVAADRHPGRAKVRLRAAKPVEDRLSGRRLRPERLAARFAEPGDQHGRGEESVRVRERRHRRLRQRVHEAVQDHRSGRHEDRRDGRARARAKSPSSRIPTILSCVEPYQAIPEVLPKLIEAKCDHLVLLSFADPKETKDLAQRFPEFDIVVTAGGGGRAAERCRKTIEGTQIAFDRSRPQGDVRDRDWPLQKRNARRFATNACRSIRASKTRPRCRSCWSNTSTIWRRLGWTDWD